MTKAREQAAGPARLVAACRRARADLRQTVNLVVAFRQSTVYGRHEPGQGYHAACVSRDAAVLTSWLCVYSSPDQVWADVGWCDWWAMPGATLLDTVLPEVGAWRGWTGLLPDRASGHRMALPPLPPVITYEAAARMARAERRARR